MKVGIDQYIEKHRFKLLLFFTLSFLIVPSYFKGWFLYEVLIFVSLTFLFTQSLIIITNWKKKYRRWVFLVFFLVLFFTWFEILVQDNQIVNLLRFLLYVVFFISTIFSLTRYIRKAKTVNEDVVIVSVVIYLLLGIIGGSTAFFFYHIYPGAYNFTYAQDKVDVLEMTYFGFITMATVGYGDITPARPETRTLAYLLAVTGQLYLAIIVAIIVGKYLSRHRQD